MTLDTTAARDFRRHYGRGTWQSGLYTVLLVSAAVHAALIAAVWVVTLGRDRAPLPYPAIAAELVRWAPEARPENLLPRESTRRSVIPEEKKAAIPDPTAPERDAARLTAERPDRPDGPDLADLDRRMQEALKRVTRKGPEDYLAGNPGGSVHGTLSAGALAVLGSEYVSRLKALFDDAWEIPSIIPAAELPLLQCRVSLRVGPDGRISEARVVQSSGNTAFDSSAVRAVQLRSEIPLPEDEMLRTVVLKDGILVNFSRKEP